MLGNLTDKIIARVLLSLAPKYVSRYSSDIRRIVMTVNMLIAALRVALPLIPDAAEKQIADHLDYVEKKWRELLELVKKYSGVDFSALA